MYNLSSILGTTSQLNVTNRGLYPTNLYAVSCRNVALSVISIVLSIGSAVLIVVTRLNRPLKVLLLNLVVCDVIIMVTLLIYGGFVQHLKSDSPLCLITVYLIFYSFLLSHASFALITMNTYVAIFFPYKYRILITTRNSLICVVVLWTCIAFVCVGSVSFSLPSDMICAPLVVAPRCGLIVIAFLMLTFDLSVMVMNITLCIRLRQARRVQIMVTAPNGARKEGGGGDIIRHPQYHATKRTDNQASTSGALSLRDEIVSPHSLSPEEHNRKRMQQQQLRQQQQDEGRVPSVQTIKIEVYQVGSRHSKISYYKNTGHHTSTSAPIEFEMRNDTTDSGNSANQDAARNFSIDRFRNLSIALIIITMWCSIMNMPFLAFLFYLSIAAENRTVANYSDFGVMATTFVIINILGDSFIYAWRFIKWKVISQKCRSICNRHD